MGRGVRVCVREEEGREERGEVVFLEGVKKGGKRTG
jgi:hypothetical protein